MAARANPVLALVFGAAWGLAASAGCDKDEPARASAEAAAPAATAPATGTASSAPEPAQAPDIVVDGANVSVGTDRLATGELGLADKVAVFLRGKPGIEGNAVRLVAMRTARPSSVVAVVTAVRKAGAASAVIRTDARDGTTQSLPVSFASSVADCATVAWIAKDAAIDVWPAGGGTARRVLKGLAGTAGLQAPGARASAVVLPSGAVAGRKLTLP